MPHTMGDGVQMRDSHVATPTGSSNKANQREHLRIAMFVGAFPVLSETFIVNQICGLLSDGHDVDIFSLGDPRSGPMHPKIGEYNLLARCVYVHQPKLSALDKIREFVLALMTESHWRSRRGLSRLGKLVRQVPGWSRMGVFRIVNRELSSGPYDIVHCQFGDLGKKVLPLVQSGLITGQLATAIRGHDVTQTGRFTREYYADLIDAGDLFTPVSNSLRVHLLNLGFPDEKIRIVRSGIDCQSLQFSPPALDTDKPLRMVSVARLVEMKGIEYGIRAAALLNKAGIPFSYEIIGEGPLAQSLNSLVSKLKLEKEVKLLGSLGHADVLEKLSDADIMVTPSVTAQNGEQEGIPNAAKEAMALGVIVVASNHSGIPELVEHRSTGYLVEERSSQQIAQAIEDLYKNPSSWTVLSQNARKRIEMEYDLPVVHDQLLNAYSILSTGQTQPH